MPYSTLLLTLPGLFLALISAVSTQQIPMRPLWKYLSPQNSSFPENSIHGYIPVDNLGNDIFYWYFPSRDNPKTDPLVVWFTGGPGCSGSLGMLTELGPFSVCKDGTGSTVNNPYSWNSNANLLFVDNPIGTGFSHAHRDDMSTTEKDVAASMLTFFRIFMGLPPFSGFIDKPIYITGESYAGHYVPVVGSALRRSITPKYKVAGIAVGNGMISAASQFLGYATYSLANSKYTGMTQQQYDTIYPLLVQCEAMMKASLKAVSDRTFNYCWNMVKNIANGPDGQKKFNWYDIKLNCTGPLCYDMSNERAFMNSQRVLTDLSADKQWVECDSLVESTLNRFDFLRNCSPEVVDLLENNVKVLIYYGDQDWICNWMGGLEWADKLNWSGKQQFADSTWSEYQGIGQMRQAKNFQFLKFYDAGHLVPMDQPKNSLIMLNLLIGAAPPSSLKKLFNAADK